MYDLYKCNENDSARFILGKQGTKKLFIVGLNPSTANRENSDNTVAKVEKVALIHNFDGFVMANLYPHRSTDPHDLPTTVDARLLKKNIEEIAGLAAMETCPVFWAAWGGDIMLRSYLVESFRVLSIEVSKIAGRWVNFGALRKDGHPRHPSRLSYAWGFSAFDSEIYAQRFA